MAIDWQTMKFAFDITRSDGDARILIPSDDPRKPGVQAAISNDKIHKFKLREVSKTEYVEVILEVSYESGEECLGITSQVEEAEKWINDANMIIDGIKKRRSG